MNGFPSWKLYNCFAAHAREAMELPECKRKTNSASIKNIAALLATAKDVAIGAVMVARVVEHH